MSSQTDPFDGERTGESVPSDEQTNTGAETDRDTTCVVCQRPLGRETDGTDGETVHPECEPALRCGISLGAPDE